MILTLLRTRRISGTILTSVIGMVCAYLLADRALALSLGNEGDTPLVYSLSEFICVITVGVAIGLLYPEHMAFWNLYRRRARLMALAFAGYAAVIAVLVVAAVGLRIYAINSAAGYRGLPEMSPLVTNVFLLLGVFLLTVAVMGPAAGVGAGLSAYIALLLGQLFLWPGGRWWPLVAFREENSGGPWWFLHIAWVVVVLSLGAWTHYRTAGAARSSLPSR